MEHGDGEWMAYTDSIGDLHKTHSVRYFSNKKISKFFGVHTREHKEKQKNVLTNDCCMTSVLRY